MNNIEKLESLIQDIGVHIEENPRIDRITREKLNNMISSLYYVTGDMKEEREENYKKLREVMNAL